MGTKQAIIKTLYYSSLFDYPLTKAELWKYHIAKKPISFRSWQKALNKLCPKVIIYQNPYFMLKGRQSLFATRKKRLKISEKKLQKNWKLLTIIGKLPTIRFLGISGS